MHSKRVLHWRNTADEIIREAKYTGGLFEYFAAFVTNTLLREILQYINTVPFVVLPAQPFIVSLTLVCLRATRAGLPDH